MPWFKSLRLYNANRQKQENKLTGQDLSKIETHEWHLWILAFALILEIGSVSAGTYVLILNESGPGSKRNTHGDQGLNRNGHPHRSLLRLRRPYTDHLWKHQGCPPGTGLP